MKITVVGSINTDFMTNTDRMPYQGETIYGNDFEILYGGKGANQAVVAAKIGAEVNMVGAVGDDTIGLSQIENQRRYDINTEAIEIIEDTTTGSANIITQDGDNQIIIIPGANLEITPEIVQKNIHKLDEADLVMIQNEIPQETNDFVINYCFNNDIKILYNPAPARLLSEELIEKVDFITPNESEFETIFGKKSTFEEVLSKLPNKVIVTLGQDGAIFHNGEKIVQVAAAQCDKVIDSTGAGDTFNAGFVVAYLSGLEIEAAIKYANIVSSLTIQKYGAQSGAPTLEEIMNHQDYNEDWEIKVQS